MNWPSNARGRYFLALLSVLVATAVRFALMPILSHERLPFITFVAAVIFAAWRCGLWPSIMTALLSVFVRWWGITPPHFSFHIRNPFVEVPNSIGFLIVSALIIALGESQRRARETLERRVLERTEALHALSGHLLNFQDAERRRLARELHDSVGQLLAAITMSVGALQRMSLPHSAAGKLADVDNLTQEATRQIRSMSHLLYPPLLDELGLQNALEWYVNGFSERSGIRTTLSAQPNLPRLGSDAEIAVFRMVQECLTNIHRHSGSAVGGVELATMNGTLRVTVRDFGRGIPPEKLAVGNGHSGIGLRGMAERFAQLGGFLDIHSDSTGTTITAHLPLAQLSHPVSASS